MSNIEQLSVKQLIEKQGLTVHQLRTTLARLEKDLAKERKRTLEAAGALSQARKAAATTRCSTTSRKILTIWFSGATATEAGRLAEPVPRD